MVVKLFNPSGKILLWLRVAMLTMREIGGNPMDDLCRVCGVRPVHVRKMCMTCYQRKRRHHRIKMRPYHHRRGETPVDQTSSTPITDGAMDVATGN